MLTSVDSGISGYLKTKARKLTHISPGGTGGFYLTNSSSGDSAILELRIHDCDCNPVLSKAQSLIYCYVPELNLTASQCQLRVPGNKIR